METTKTSKAREHILASIREHLAASIEHDRRVLAQHLAPTTVQVNGSPVSALSNIELFKTNLEAVNGHCVIAQTELEIVHALTRIISELKHTQLNPRRIALSDAKGLERLVRLVAVQIDEVAVTPSSSEMFDVDVGITTAQAAIAETGTLVLDSSREQNRLISLVPPVHIAIVEATNVYSTLGETLSLLQSDEEISPVVTFITGPSRTADIELTLAIGVHGPQELYVIIYDGPPLT
jgi:L-lactate dehydrogenase complex protein LldG